MESQKHPDHSRVSDSFLATLKRAERGDKQAMEQLLLLFELDIHTWPPSSAFRAKKPCRR